MNAQPLAYMSFKPGNQIVYWQDFATHCGLPSGVRFAVYPLYSEPYRYQLVGPGYGQVNCYGNGAIHVTLEPAPQELPA